MRSLSEDTKTDFEKVWIEKMRQLPGWRRLQLAGQLSSAVRALTMAGLRKRQPSYTEPELRRSFAEIHLGQRLADQFFSRKPSP